MPIIPHRLVPETKDTFWVNLMGRGYPAPRKKFRWCTERMKIYPSNKFIREHWLRRVLTAQMDVRRLGPPDVHDIELISLPELQEIRRIWLYEKHQFDDSVPTIYEEITGQAFPKGNSDDSLLRRDDWGLLSEVCGQDEEFFEFQTQLLDIEREFRGMTRRAGIFEAMEDRFRAYQYGGEQEAVDIRMGEENRRRAAIDRSQLSNGEPQRPQSEPQGLLFGAEDENGTGEE